MMDCNCKQRFRGLLSAWLVAAALCAAAPAGAVVIVGGDNGWEVSFDGNVNGFYVYEDADSKPAGTERQNFNIPGDTLKVMLGAFYRQSSQNSQQSPGVRNLARALLSPRGELGGLVIDYAKDIGMLATSFGTDLGQFFSFLDAPLPDFDENCGGTAVPCHIDIDAIADFQGSTLPDDAEVSRVRTGLLPAFFSFNVRSPEVAGLRGSARISFAPQIQNANTKNNFGNGTQAGAQIDLREVFFNVDGSFGTLSVGRTLSLFQRHSILTDMTLFGVGVQGGVGGGGTTLGRIGYGYVYPQFNGRISYKTLNMGGFQLEVGAFDPSSICSNVKDDDGKKICATGTKKPRFETEITYGTDYDYGSFLGWFGAMWQDAEGFQIDKNRTTDVTAWGISGGLRLSYSGFTFTGSGYRGDALGSVLMLDTDSLDRRGDERENYGWLTQLTYSMGALKLGISYGENNSDNTTHDGTMDINSPDNASLRSQLRPQFEARIRERCRGRPSTETLGNCLKETNTIGFPDATDNATSLPPLSFQVPVHIGKLSSFTFGAYYDITPWFKLVGEYTRAENEWHNYAGKEYDQSSNIYSLGAFFTW